MTEGSGGQDLTSGALREAALQRYEAGRAAWPAIELDFERFASYFARHATGKSFPKEAYAADMYLACACAHGVEGALVAFENTLAADVGRAAASVDSSRAFVEDTVQATRERLLVRKGSEPARISEYAGRASLRSWLCVVAVRRAISERRRKGDRYRDQKPLREVDERLAQGTPELEYLRGRYKEEFEEAVRDAIQRLPSRERLLLRLNLVDGMSVDRLGTMYQVGRSTAARWLAIARRKLFEQTRRDLRARLRVTSDELESLVTDIHSQLEVSVLKHLARTKSDRE